MNPKHVLFIDRDGTIIVEPADFQIDALHKVQLARGVIPALLSLQQAGFSLVMVSNQDGLGTPSFPKAAFDESHAFMMTLLGSQGVVFDAVFICPHLPSDGCECRKPRTGLLTDYLASTDLDTRRSAVLGDRDTDMQLAENLSLRGIRIDPTSATSWPEATRQLLGMLRSSRVERTTKETRITAEVCLDATEPVHVATGIGFFDHMLEQIAKHGGFSMSLQCAGDLHIDEHHTVEDCALTLGQALREALGDKRGIARYGFVAPMDEAEAHVSLDLSGRAHTTFDGKFPREMVGQLPTELVSHFFRSLSDAMAATLHVRVQGENAHHMVEACFKGVGRALRMAIRTEGHEIPSSKGVL